MAPLATPTWCSGASCLCPHSPSVLSTLDFRFPLIDAPATATPTSSPGQNLWVLQASAWRPFPLGSCPVVGQRNSRSLLDAHLLHKVLRFPVSSADPLAWLLVFSILKKGTWSCPRMNSQHCACPARAGAQNKM